MVCRVAEALRPVADSVTVVAGSAGAYDDLGLATIADVRSELGPMGGLEAALADRVARYGEGWLLLSSCDLTEPDAGLARGLLEHVSGGVQVVAYKGARWEPLFALYHSSMCTVVGRQLDAGRFAMWRLIECAEHVAVSLPGGVTGIGQANMPGDAV
jgi:molybdenum cofactor guanylyltransferase